MTKVKEPIRTPRPARTRNPSKGQQVGYLRVSSLDQNEVRQLEGLALNRTFTDKASGKDGHSSALQRRPSEPGARSPSMHANSCAKSEAGRMLNGRYLGAMHSSNGLHGSGRLVGKQGKGLRSFRLARRSLHIIHLFWLRRTSSVAMNGQPVKTRRQRCGSPTHPIARGSIRGNI
jgi:hypothetical protein